MDDWCEVESLASSWRAVDVPQEDWSELDSVASVRSLATPHGEDPSTCDLGSRGPSPLSFDGDALSLSSLAFDDESVDDDASLGNDGGSVCTARGWPALRGLRRVGAARAGARSYRDALLSVPLPSLDALLLPPPSADGPALVTLPVATGRALRRRRKPAASTASARSLGLRMCTGPRGSRRRLIPLAPITESAPPGAGARDDDETQGSLSDSSSDSGSYCA